MEREKILGKYFQGNQSYLKWNGSLTLCPSFSKHVQCTHANTHLLSEHAHKAVLETQMHTQMASLQMQSSFFGLFAASPPAARLTDTLVYFSHAHFKFQHFPPTEKTCVCLVGSTKKKENINKSSFTSERKQTNLGERSN